MPTLPQARDRVLAHGLRTPTLGTDGCLPTGSSLVDAIEQVDTAAGGGPDYYMINCVHPIYFAETLASGDPRLKRVRGLMPNASSKSHEELEEANELDEGNPAELANGIIYLADHRDEGIAMGIRGRKYVQEHFDREDQAEKLAVLIENLVNSNKV